jgi:hypothetical protein
MRLVLEKWIHIQIYFFWYTIFFLKIYSFFFIWRLCMSVAGSGNEPMGRSGPGCWQSGLLRILLRSCLLVEILLIDWDCSICCTCNFVFLKCLSATVWSRNLVLFVVILYLRILVPVPLNINCKTLSLVYNSFNSSPKKKKTLKILF